MLGLVICVAKELPLTPYSVRNAVNGYTTDAVVSKSTWWLLVQLLYARGAVTQPSMHMESVQLESAEVDGDAYGSVSNFCYLEDMLEAEGGVDATVTTRTL